MDALAFLLIIAVCVVVFYGLHWQAPLPAGMPHELAEASLWLAEKEIACASPVPLHGKPDQVFKLKSGKLVVVDVKTHSRVHRSDVMQMSVYRVILMGLGHDVENYGYVRAIVGGQEQFLRCDLYSTEIVVKGWNRHRGLMNGSIVPAPTKVALLCRGCGHKMECKGGCHV